MKKEDVVTMVISEFLNKSKGKLLFSKYETAKMLSQAPITLDRNAKRGLIKPNRSLRRPQYPITEIIRYALDERFEKSA